MRKLLLSVIAISLITVSFAQEKEKKEGYQFTDKINLDVTSVKDQNRSGTCWSFSANSFFEQEMLRMGKPATDLSEMFVVRHCYKDKADKYVRMHGLLNFSQGGAFSDVVYVMDKYGIVPESVYSGLNYGEKKHVHGEIEAVLKGIIDAVIKNKNRKITPAWKEGFDGVLDAYFGKLPEKFTYEGKEYTPKTFLRDYCGIHPEEYVSITSYMHHPFYEKFPISVQDNWLWKESYNVPLDDLMAIMDHALETGFSIAWGADVSEKGFNTKKVGVAIVPDVDMESMDNAEIAKWETMSERERNKKLYSFEKPGKEKKITQEMRQAAYDNYETTDDHGMHIFGTAVDQAGNKYYKVKNSWGNYNGFEGNFYASKPYVAYKTMNIVINKKALTKAMRKKLGIK